SANTLRSKTDRVARGKYDHTFEADHQIAKRVYEISQKYHATMAQVALAWQWAKGVTSPIVGATKSRYLDDAVGAFNLNLTAEDLNYLEELYVPHKIVGAIDHNPPADVMLLDEDPA
ncbi:MAG: aldo/keto reductase, partial [Lactobacillus sp.]|nr:aldo/keto reductase [Lactobacillus sp.]